MGPLTVLVSHLIDTVSPDLMILSSSDPEIFLIEIRLSGQSSAS